jgi:ABC-2 type transport system permease protein
VPLFFVGAGLFVFSLTSLGIFLGTVGRTMPQFSLIAFPVFIIMNLLSGGRTPLEGMPVWLQRIMQVSPSTHFIAIAEAVLFRQADFVVVWQEFATIAAIGAVFFAGSAWRFRKTLVA